MSPMLTPALRITWRPQVDKKTHCYCDRTLLLHELLCVKQQTFIFGNIFV